MQFIATLINLTLFFIGLGSLSSSYGQPVSYKPAGAIVNGYFPDTYNDNDSIFLTLHGEFSAVSYGSPDIIKTLTFVNKKGFGHFYFDLPEFSSPIYVSLHHSGLVSRKNGKLNKVPIFENYIICPGDSIFLRSDFQVHVFSGRGGTRMQAWHELMRSRQTDFFSMPRVHVIPDAKAMIEYYQRQYQLFTAVLSKLNDYKKTLSAEDMLMLEAEITAHGLEAVYRSLAWFNFYKGDKGFEDQLFQYYGKHYFNRREQVSPDSIWTLSPSYTWYLYWKTWADEKFRRASAGNSMDSIDFLRVAASKYKGTLKEKILLNYSVLHPEAAANKELPFLRTQISSVHYRSVLDQLSGVYAKGSVVSDFTFIDSTGTPVGWNDLKGKTVLMDLWFTGCSFCKTVAAKMPEVERAFQGDTTVVFLSISVDTDKQRWLQSINPNPSSATQLPHAGKHFSGKGSRYLYTGGKGIEDEFVKKYVAQGGYPRLILMDKNGRLVSYNPPRPDSPGGVDKLIAVIRATVNETL